MSEPRPAPAGLARIERTWPLLCLALAVAASASALHPALRALLVAAPLALVARRVLRSIGSSGSAGSGGAGTTPPPQSAATTSQHEGGTGERQRLEFLAGLGHEIRTPMSSILGMARVLLSTELSRKQRTLADRILRSGENLLHLLDDLLEYSRIESGNIELALEPLSPRELAEDCIDLLTQVAQAKGVALVLRVDPDLPERVEADAGRLRQILLNLVNNAIKFTQEGHVVVELEAEQGESDGCRLLLRVRDSGPGIPSEQLESIFQSFRQGDASIARRFGGHGLGLAISRRLARLMGGEITVESQVGRGSTFLHSLPARLMSDSHRCRDDYPKELIGECVLLVHPEGEEGRMLEWQLAALGCAVHWERTVLGAIASLRGPDPFAVVLLDPRMPRAGELLSSRERRRSASVRFLCLNSLFGKESLVASGAGSLSRPVKLHELIDALCSRSPERKPMPQREPVPEPALDLIETRLRRRSKILLAEDDPANQDVVRYLLASRGYQLDAVASGPAALEAFEKGGYDLVLMDIRLPGCDGFETTRLIREREQALGLRTRTPILAVTADVLLEDRKRCNEAGMDDFLCKPFRPSELEGRVEHWLWKRYEQESNRLLAEPRAPLPEAAEQGVLEAGTIQPLLQDEDPSGRELAVSLVAGFLERSPKLVTDLQQSLSREDFADARSLSHRFVSTAGHVGARILVERLRAFESACRRKDSAETKRLLGELEHEIGRSVDALQRLRTDLGGSPRPSEGT